ncbi:MAG: hypothetical protein LBB61_07925 [Treponema sp.]|jgi:hypothetical protein|nr:hypothetical protein [Treponema sp.]
MRHRKDAVPSADVAFLEWVKGLADYAAVYATSTAGKVSLIIGFYSGRCSGLYAAVRCTYY